MTSFYLVPSDGVVPLPKFLPGQYVSLQLMVPQLGYLQSRQYSLSEAPRAIGQYYRISVKRDEGEKPGVPGIISNMLTTEYQVGSEVELSHPQGEFTVDPYDHSKQGVPAVLISAGVGATPLMSILGSLVPRAGEPRPEPRPLSWIHAARSSTAQPFREEVKQICRDNENVSVSVFLNSTGPDDKRGEDYDFVNEFLDLSKVDKEKDLHLGDRRTEYFICGSELFMVNIRRKLVSMGVDRDRIFLELFATGNVREDL